MLPPKSDPIWKEIILSSHDLKLKALPSQMLMMRVRLLAKDRTPQKIEEAISIAYSFFETNQLIVQEDIATIFNSYYQEKK